MKKIFTFLVVSTMFSFVLNAQNFTVDETNDTINVNTTWSYDTVFMDASVYVLDDVTLTINPGTVVLFNDFYKIKVEGTLLSEGTETDTILYTVADTTGYYNFSHTGWDGIEFDTTGIAMEDNDTTRFSYCAFYFGKETNEWDGGGVFRIAFYSKVKIENSLFAYNYSSGAGGAIGIQYEAEPVVSNCKFLNNNAEDGGGAINIGCYDDYEKFDQPVINNCFFSNNQTIYSGSSYGGGAVKLSGNTDALVVNNIFKNNSSFSQGGALITSGYANPYVINNLFVNNTAEHNGGAIGIKYYAGGYFINNTIVNNYSGNNGGAVSIGCNNDSVFFANNIIGGNTDLDNDYDQFYIGSEDEDIKFYNNDIQGGLSTIYPTVVYEGNIESDPQFIDAWNGNFKLQSSSPCIDAGKDTTDYITDYDLAGVQRIIDGFVDMGAYEYNPYENIISIENNSFSVFPNPAKDFIYLKTDKTEIGNVEIRNISGKLIYSNQIVNNNCLINTKNFAKGMYFIIVNFANESSTQKIIIQ